MPGLTAVNWYALLLPAGAPRALFERLNVAAIQVMNTPETRASLAAMGGESAAYSSDQAAEFLRSEYARWAKVIREANIKME
jgi:tripartite-type tricarboxylate transporter receptor subunit TctC